METGRVHTGRKRRGDRGGGGGDVPAAGLGRWQVKAALLSVSDLLSLFFRAYTGESRVWRFDPRRHADVLWPEVTSLCRLEVSFFVSPDA